MNTKFLAATLLLGSSMAVSAAQNNDCQSLPSHDALQAKLAEAISVDNGGFNLDMWATVVNRYGTVCAVVKAASAATANTEADPWPGSRVISAQKANTANSFSNRQSSISTAWLYAATQPGASLFGLQESNPVDTRAAYRGDATKYGTANDSLHGLKVGGVNVFGGGLALFNEAGDVIGAIGVSGDTSCADHNIAWRTRDLLIAATDAIIKNTPAGIANFEKLTYGEHPACGNSEQAIGQGELGSAD